MSRIAHFLPSCGLREVDRVAVRASPEEAYRAFRHFNGADIPWVAALFAVREVPDRLRGKPVERKSIGIDSVAGGESGFAVLEDRPGESVVVGAVGKFWSMNLEFKDISPERFTSFDEPGWGKVAWEIRAEPSGSGGSIVSFEVRVAATDEESWRKFVRYFFVIGRFSHAIRRAVLHRLVETLGAEAVPVKDRPLPGDDVVDNARIELTHAIDIAAPSAAVWPYLVQMGRWHGGWYSYDRLDNDGAPSAEHIVRRCNTSQSAI